MESEKCGNFHGGILSSREQIIHFSRRHRPLLPEAHTPLLTTALSNSHGRTLVRQGGWAGYTKLPTSSNLSAAPPRRSRPRTAPLFPWRLQQGRSNCRTRESIHPLLTAASSTSCGGINWTSRTLERRGGWASGFYSSDIDCECFSYDTVFSNSSQWSTFSNLTTAPEKITTTKSKAAQSLHYFLC
mmetsp:Transcript_2562/g.3964  ORF Transcript_2562/g.3964 Transcript_2562/m.3964 type:complete len:186 (+) Transcript_2562:331-888(+)